MYWIVLAWKDIYGSGSVLLKINAHRHFDFVMAKRYLKDMRI